MPGIPASCPTPWPGQPDLVLGLLTGNVAMGAQLKLESFGIWHYFQLGAYGSDHHDRNTLVPIAQQRAHALLGHIIPAQQLRLSSVIPHVTLPARTRTALVQ